MKKFSVSLISAAAIFLGIAAGCSSSNPEAPTSRPLSQNEMQERGISEGVAPGAGGQAQAPTATANSAQGDL